MAKSAMDTMIERIDSDMAKLAAMKQYLLDGADAGDETARATKAKRGRKKKAGLPAEQETV